MTLVLTWIKLVFADKMADCIVFVTEIWSRDKESIMEVLSHNFKRRNVVFHILSQNMTSPWCWEHGTANAPCVGSPNTGSSVTFWMSVCVYSLGLSLFLFPHPTPLSSVLRA